MIDYENIVSQWQKDVTRYCESRGIQNMDLKNLRMGDVCDYDLYNVYKSAQSAVVAYRRTPASKLRADEMVAAIKKWYVATATGNWQKMSMRMMTNTVFAHFIGRKR
ncbi:MAG: hypothetical protein NC311_03130 [Muribaculaceae bacterium]|nr:hypothetical protein [Muribaculaceae bacterium]